MGTILQFNASLSPLVWNTTFETGSIFQRVCRVSFKVIWLWRELLERLQDSDSFTEAWGANTGGTSKARRGTLTRGTSTTSNGRSTSTGSTNRSASIGSTSQLSSRSGSIVNTTRRTGWLAEVPAPETLTEAPTKVPEEELGRTGWDTPPVMILQERELQMLWAALSCVSPLVLNGRLNLYN